MPITVRLARPDDVDALTALAAELGYAAATGGVAERLARFALRPDDHAVYVAHDDDRVVGWIHVGRRETLETPARAEILGLVVNTDRRRAGVGRTLVDAAEIWAAVQGLREVVVRSNVVRPDSHPFYERIGYARVKTQHVYLKAAPARVPR
jgi:predicted N-acetyltransferase YhbS